MKVTSFPSHFMHDYRRTLKLFEHDISSFLLQIYTLSWLKLSSFTWYNWMPVCVSSITRFSDTIPPPTPSLSSLSASARVGFGSSPSPNRNLNRVSLEASSLGKLTRVEWCQHRRKYGLRMPPRLPRVVQFNHWTWRQALPRRPVHVRWCVPLELRASGRRPIDSTSQASQCFVLANPVTQDTEAT